MTAIHLSKLVTHLLGATRHVCVSVSSVRSTRKASPWVFKATENYGWAGNVHIFFLGDCPRSRIVGTFVPGPRWFFLTAHQFIFFFFSFRDIPAGLCKDYGDQIDLFGGVDVLSVVEWFIRSC